MKDVGLVVVVGCGKAKQTKRSPAGEMYLGSFHRLCREVADHLRPDRQLIVSAKHGLIPLHQPISPYDVRPGDPGAIAPARLTRQAEHLGVRHADTVIVLAGRPYVELLRADWPYAVAPLVGARGIGEMRAILAQIKNQR